MYTRVNSSILEAEGGVNAYELIELDGLSEQIYRDLGGQVPRERVFQIVTDVAAEFSTAKVTTYIPIFVQRQARERLKGEIGGEPVQI